MDLSKELIAVLQKAKDDGSYFSPWTIQGVLEAIYDGDPFAEEKISDELSKWAVNMFSR